MVKADLHIHTAYSMDCATSLDEIITRCVKLDINCLAITDHGTINGALKMKGLAPFTIIVSEEIVTPYGEVIGMFLTEKVPSGLSVEETIKLIKDQDGLVCIPHPCDRLRTSSFIDNNKLGEISPLIDIIEVFNARSLCPGSRARANKLAQNLGKVSSAGSDAHTAAEIGSVYIEMPEFINQSEFIKSLAQGRICGHKSNPLVHLASTLNKFNRSSSPKEC
ncbi:PHP domain-containing protein [Chloroflexota bacterium]